MLCWTPTDDDTEDVTVTHVKGTKFGVPEVEFSHHLELLAGMYAPVNDPPQPRLEIEWSPPEFLSESDLALSSPSPPASTSSSSIAPESRKFCFCFCFHSYLK
jgi:hypothetical protein